MKKRLQMRASKWWAKHPKRVGAFISFKWLFFSWRFLLSLLMTLSFWSWEALQGKKTCSTLSFSQIWFKTAAWNKTTLYSGTQCMLYWKKQASWANCQLYLNRYSTKFLSGTTVWHNTFIKVTLHEEFVHRCLLYFISNNYFYFFKTKSKTWTQSLIKKYGKGWLNGKLNGRIY